MYKLFFSLGFFVAEMGGGVYLAHHSTLEAAHQKEEVDGLPSKTNGDQAYLNTSQHARYVFFCQAESMSLQ